MHLGLIGGIGPAATAYYYRGLVRHGGDIALTISHAQIARLLDNQKSGDVQAQAEIFASHVASLKAAGAQIAAVTSIAGHFCHDALEPLSPLPLLSILDVLNTHFAAEGVTRIGMIGSTVGMETRLFGAITQTEVLVPSPEDLPNVGAAYGALAERGSATPEEAEICLSAGRKLMELGADAVLLGGTDLFLVYEGTDPGYPVIDAAALHIAALDRIARQA
ncbi:MAG: aspartate/glutamate racemase family protein [Pseudomonadota bacterium]